MLDRFNDEQAQLLQEMTDICGVSLKLANCIKPVDITDVARIITLTVKKWLQRSSISVTHFNSLSVPGGYDAHPIEQEPSDTEN